MKSYDISDAIEGRVHTVEITLQRKEYKGHISFKVIGNCVGFEVLDIDLSLLSTVKLIENDCNFLWDDDEETYSFVLEDKYGSTYSINGVEEDEIGDYMVAIKIVDCKKYK